MSSMENLFDDSIMRLKYMEYGDGMSQGERAGGVHATRVSHLIAHRRWSLYPSRTHTVA